MNATETRVKELAGELERALIIAKRDNGTEYYRLRDGSPEWMTDAIHAAHGDMFPDDNRYRFISDAATLISESDDLDSARESIESDIYTHDLTQWLGSRNDRFSYCDEFQAEYGTTLDFDTIKLLQGGQIMEREEVLSAVIAALEGIA